MKQEQLLTGWLAPSSEHSEINYWDLLCYSSEVTNAIVNVEKAIESLNFNVCKYTQMLMQT